MRIQLVDRNPALDATPKQRHIRNFKNWGTVTIVSVLAASAITIFALSLKLLAHTDGELTKGIEKLAMAGVLLGGMVATPPLLIFSFIFLNKAIKNQRTLNLLKNGFEGTREEFIARVISTGAVDRNGTSIVKASHSEDERGLPSTGWCRSNLSPNEKELLKLFYEKGYAEAYPVV